MTFTKEVLDGILKGYRGPDDFCGYEGIMKQLAKAPTECAAEAELSDHPGYEKRSQDKTPGGNRRGGKTGKMPRTGGI
jgi:hypothetical protein